ncbi:hypothetical protein [Terricaulis sp.]|uniref:hypothetical protein n=1 Tax=Terricaulis sp. TaxID=2768686 RepID=UPI003783329D
MPIWSAFEQPPEVALHEPITLKRVAIGAGAGALLGAGLAAHFFAFEWLYQRDAWASDGRFGQIVGMTAVIGAVAYYCVRRILQRVDIRVTPWLAAPLAMWLTAEQLVRITPHSSDPLFGEMNTHTSQIGIASFVVFVAIAMLGVAIVRFFDWHIGDRERREIAREQTDQ